MSNIVKKILHLWDNLEFDNIATELKKLGFSENLINKIKKSYAFTSYIYKNIDVCNYLILKELIITQKYTPAIKSKQELINSIDELRASESLLSLYSYIFFVKEEEDKKEEEKKKLKKIKELFNVIEDNFINFYHNENHRWYSQLKLYTFIVSEEQVIIKPYFNITNISLSDADKQILQFIAKDEIAESFELINKIGADNYSVNEFKADYINGTNPNFRSDFEKFLKNYLIEFKIADQKKTLVYDLKEFVNKYEIFPYFDRLIELGLQDKKFETLKIDFIRGYSGSSFYKDLENYAEEAVAILFQEAIKDTKRANPIVVTHFKNSNAGSLDMFGDFSYQFCPQINLLLGKNGYGKTYFLRHLVAILQDNDVVKPQYFSSYELGVNFGKDSYEFTPRQFWAYDKVALLAITDARFMDKSMDLFHLQPSEYLEIEKDGGYFFLHQKPMQSLINNLFISLATQYLEGEKKVFDLMADVISELTKPDIVSVSTETKERFQFVDVQNNSNSFIGASFQILVKTEASPQPLPLQKISQGTMSVLVIFSLIYDFLDKLYPQSEDCTQEAGIVFIDEIDAHLHPSWQRKIIGLLRDKFPKVQFFLTAHSPLLVAGCKENEVSVMKKDETNGRFYVKTFHRHYIGADLQELYHDVFGLGDLRDESYLDYLKDIPNAEEKRLAVEALAEKDTLTAEERKKVEELYYLWQVMKNEESKEKKFRNDLTMAELQATIEVLRMEKEVLKQKLKEENGK